MLMNSEILDMVRRRFLPTIKNTSFDAEFYRNNYPDLSEMKRPNDLYKHYLEYGSNEGRFANYADLKYHFEKIYGELPEGFSPKEYVSLYPDLRGMTEGQAVEHYLLHGRREGRTPFRLSCEIYRELYFKNQIVSDQDLMNEIKEKGYSEGKICNGADVMRLKGVSGGGRWIEAIQVDEFAMLNYGWAGQISSRMQAVDAMLAEGIARLAPISLALQFDPVFYRETHPQLRRESDEACYRSWLFTGFEDGEPGSPAQFFAELEIDLEAFPRSFQWRRYLGLARYARKDWTRWSALRDFIRVGFARGRRPVSGADAKELYAALGAHFLPKRAALSVRAFELAQKHGKLGDDDLRRLADGYFRLRQWGPALRAFDAATRVAGAGVLSFCNAARAALELKETDRAFEILKASRDKVAGAPEWRKALREAVEAEFELASSRARELLKKQARGEADEILTRAVARAAERFFEFDPLGAPLPAAPNGKVVILANVDLRQCTHYRMEQKEQLLETLGRDYAVYPASEVEDFISALPGAAAAIFYRLPAFPMNVRAIEIARALGVATYYEIDDLLFDSKEYPEPLESYGAPNAGFYELLQFGVPLFRAAMALCDYGIASTTALAAHMEPVVRKNKVFILPNGLDNRNLHFLDAPPLRVRGDGSIVIFYASGTKAHNSDFLELAGPALVSLMARHKNVRLMIVGYLSLDASFDTIRDRIVSVGWVPDIKSYWSLLAEADINIAVLARCATTDAKSEIKWLEAAVLGLPSVVSGTARYREVLQDGVDALIADTPKDWAMALERLITEPLLRARIARNAKAKAASFYSLEVNARSLAALLPPQSPSLPEAVAPAKPKRRVILVNLFFTPQALGGAPRVVQNNLDCFLDGDAKNEFEFAVVTTDFGSDGGNRLRVENYRGCPVFRISPEKTSNQEWQPDQPEMGGIFREILNIFKPDLVHFHCIEVFSGAVVEECLRAGVAYVNTLHDAWWVSDWHFLTDSRDRVREPYETYPVEPPAPISMGESLDRRRMLAPLLKKSEAILGVSHAFTEIHKACGFDKAIAVPNGAPPLTPAPRVPSASGRVRLAHFGGMSKFKGFFLVQAVLRQHRFENLELTVIDNSRQGGAERRCIWGGTPVRIIGKTAPEKMPELYAEHDVLLAPSLWPEPFGLVSREALSAGLWVVASDRGAIGEDVKPGVNGWVIDVSTPQGLLEVLSEIEAEPEKFLKSPPPTQLRSAQQQADEILQIYRRVLARPRAIGVYERRTVDKGLPPLTNRFDLRQRAERANLETRRGDAPKSEAGVAQRPPQPPAASELSRCLGNG
jgi:glycosyltransferase involved in cell wall biosynthesis